MNKLERTLMGLAAAGLSTWLLRRATHADYSFQDRTVLITGGAFRTSQGCFPTKI